MSLTQQIGAFTSAKGRVLFFILAGFFLVNTFTAEMVGGKIFSLEKTLGFEPFNWTLFQTEGLGFNLTAGVLLWPVVFIMTDIINEYFGPKVIKYLSYVTVILIFYAFLMIYGTIHLSPNEWWALESGKLDADSANHLDNMDVAYAKVMGQGAKIIIASMIAFIIGQIVDALVFQKIKRLTGEKLVWLRATGSTFISQFIDSFVVLIVAFYFFSDWDLTRVLAIGSVNYLYKFVVAILLTPAIYLAHYLIDTWLGKELSDRMKSEAHR